MPQKPKPCPCCDEVFSWPDDGVKLTMENNAHWQLTRHMQAAHSEKLFQCPRGNGMQGTFMSGETFWDADHTCSFCGSLSPEKLFEALDAGVTIGATDKNYKIYVNTPGFFAKFYFQHLDMPGMEKFVEYYNSGRIKFESGDHFYVRPYFISSV